MNDKELGIANDINFTCRRCGHCCRCLDVPLLPEEMERLGRIDWGSVAPELAGKVLFSQSPATTQLSSQRFQLARQDGRCVFLEGDNICLIEDRIGRDAKPLACRQFPLVFVDEPQCTIVSASFVCSSVLENSGEPLAAREGEIRSLLEEPTAGGDEYGGWEGRVAIPPRIVLTAAIGLDWHSYEAMERRLTTLLEDETHILVIRLLAWQRFFDGALAQYARGSKTSGPFSKWIEHMYSPKAESWLYGLESPWKKGKPAKQRYLVAAAAPLMESSWQGKKSSVNGSMLGQRLAIIRGKGVVRLPSIAAELDVRKLVGVQLDQDLPELRPLLVRYLREKLRQKCLLDYSSLWKGIQYLLLHLALIKWYSLALAAGRGMKTVGVDELRMSIQAVESLYVSQRRLAGVLARRRLDVTVLNLILDALVNPEDIAADYSEGYLTQ
jgi:Fe-S-cluster containining protein